MTISDASGFLASSLVFLTFWMKSPIRLRCVAICSNVAFLAYGIGLDLLPVAMLHAALLPVNVWRLKELLDVMGHRRIDAGMQAAEITTPAS